MRRLLAAVVAVSAAYWLVALRQVAALLRPSPAMEWEPTVAILKPVRGLDHAAEENLESFCRQDHPRVEVLFGVEDRRDPAFPLLQQLAARYANARVVVGSAPAANPKVALLGMLAEEAAGEVLVVSDSDMRVEPDYLRRVLAELAAPGVGLVTCPYRGVEPVTLTARMEALYMDCHFVPSAVLGSTLVGLPFGLGSTVALRRTDLEAIGGFEALADHLADDHELGARIAGLGRSVRMSGYVVSCIVGSTSFAEQWRREVRWARATRVSRPALYPGYLLTFTTPLAVLYALVEGPGGAGVVAGAIAWRWAVGWLLTGWDGNRALRRWLPLLPLRDALTVGVWVTGAFGRRVTWRGRRYLVPGDGRMVAEPTGHRLRSAPAVRALDATIRRAGGFIEFDDEPDGLFRIKLARAHAQLTFTDGTRLVPGDVMGELHWRNEVIPQMDDQGIDLGWGLTFSRRLHRSFAALARSVRSDPRLEDLAAVRGNLYLSAVHSPEAVSRVLARLGFEDVAAAGDGPLEQVRRGYATLLLRTFHPAASNGRRLRRHLIWMSRAALLERYGE
jgi:ceramide glucosyltransferase